MSDHDQMQAVLLTGHGGFEALEVRDDVAVPEPGDGEVLIRVHASAINNTDINTRTAWYSRSVSDGTTEAGGAGGFGDAQAGDASWAGAALTFPRIQGIDVCGEIVEVGAGVDRARIGERVLLEPCLREPVGWQPYRCWFLGSECDGGFAEYVAVASAHTYRIDSRLTDRELASFPCAYATAENMLERAGLGAGETVLITGASGGVGSAAIQLAKRRGAHVIAQTSAGKSEAVRELGADRVVERGADLTGMLGEESVDLVIDLVAGPVWEHMLTILKRGGRYAVAGAIGGPIVELDVRRLYLKDLSFFGCAVLDETVFPNLIGYIEREEIRPVIAEVYPLSEIVTAQKAFLAKGFVGKIILVPDRLHEDAS